MKDKQQEINKLIYEIFWHMEYCLSREHWLVQHIEPRIKELKALCEEESPERGDSGTSESSIAD